MLRFSPTEIILKVKKSDKKTMDKKETKEDKIWKAEALFLPGGVLLGFGVGFLINNVPVGMFGGLGLGFILFALTVILKNR